MSIKAFCKTAGFHENAYYYWQRKLRKAACQELQAEVNEQAVIPRGWAICGEVKAESSESRINIEIGKCRVAVSSGFSPEELAKACRVLMTLC
jgi:hypothetical protein